MLVECELIGGVFDGKIHINDTDKKQFLSLTLTRAVYESGVRFFEFPIYKRESINDTKYYYVKTKQNIWSV